MPTSLDEELVEEQKTLEEREGGWTKWRDRDGGDGGREEEGWRRGGGGARGRGEGRGEENRKATLMDTIATPKLANNAF